VSSESIIRLAPAVLRKYLAQLGSACQPREASPVGRSYPISREDDGAYAQGRSRALPHAHMLPTSRCTKRHYVLMSARISWHSDWGDRPVLARRNPRAGLRRLKLCSRGMKVRAVRDGGLWSVSHDSRERRTSTQHLSQLQRYGCWSAEGIHAIRQ
jgi:hypothetical protein